MKRFYFFSLLLMALVMGMGVKAAAQDMPHIYINPGHGGHDSDDRNVVVPPFASGDTAGFWESNSNLWKGFALQEVLRKKGYTTSISRLANQTSNDLALSTIVALCNQSGADVFYSIHSNATGAGENYRINFPLGLYRGPDNQPIVPESDRLALELVKVLYQNQSTVWTSNYATRGDWSFYPQWNNQGLGVLRGNNAISMLDEGSFHDYIPETYRLINHDYDWVEGFNFSIGADNFFGYSETLPQGIITGNLRDERVMRTATYVMHGADARQPINGATVRLLDLDDNELATTTTDQLQNGIYLFKYLDPGQYKVEVSEPEHFTQTKIVEVTANAVTYCNFDLKKVRNTPPEVVSYSPVWNDGDDPVLCNTPVVINFNWDMDIPSTEAAFEISPAVEGSFTWEDTNYRLVFTPTDAYDVNTHYTVTVRASAEHAGGTAMEHDFTMGFTTQERNHMAVTALFPREDVAVHYKSPIIELRTDAQVNGLNVYDNFHVYDKNGNELGYNRRQLKCGNSTSPYGFVRLPMANDFNVGEKYRLYVERWVQDMDGIHLAEEIDHEFVAVDAGEAKAEQVIYDGEQVDGITTGGSNVNAKVTAVTTHLFGSKAMQLAYEFDAEDGEPVATASFAEPLEQQFTAGDTIMLHIDGDMSCNELLACFEAVDGDGDDFDLSLGDIDYHGWRFVKCPVENRGTFRLKGFAVKHHTQGYAKNMGLTGKLILDDVLWSEGEIFESGVSETTLAGVTVQPNPSSDYIVASAAGYIRGVELYGMNGQLVARNGANYINVTGIAAGTYVFKVYVNGLVSTHKVVVVH